MNSREPILGIREVLYEYRTIRVGVGYFSMTHTKKLAMRTFLCESWVNHVQKNVKNSRVTFVQASSNSRVRFFVFVSNS